MLAGALIPAAVALDEPWAGAQGLRTLERIRGEQQDPHALAHLPGGVGGLLDDQVQVALAAIEAFEATGEPAWLEWSVGLMERVWADYLDPVEGGLFDTASREGPGLLPARAKPIQDAPTPSPNGIAALCLARIAEHTQAPEWYTRRDALLRAFAGAASGLGIFGSALLAALDWAVHPATHLVIVEGGERDSAMRAETMHQAARRTFLPRRVVRLVRAADRAGATLAPAIRGMLGDGTVTRGFLCVGASCQLPAEDPMDWQARLADLAAGLADGCEG